MSVIGLTMGEPGGIGAEITAKAWHILRDEKSSPVFFVLGCGSHFERTFASLSLPCDIAVIDKPSDALSIFAERLPILPLSGEVVGVAGEAHADNARLVLESVERAVSLCRNGEISAMVTNPIHKASLMRSGFAFSGHTDYLASLCGLSASDVVMMLANDYVRTVPVTVHCPLSEVPLLLSGDLIKRVARITWRSLRDNFGILSPRLAVAGLNPHAGESGRLGREESDFIDSAVSDLRSEGIDIRGSFAADSLFSASMRASYDVALCMYHDQALIPVKALDFGRSVNVSLGLPIVRTSPDHGTAFDIAGRGVASADSLVSALRMAFSLSV